MTVSSAELIQRADLAITDLATNGGILSPTQANQFIDFVVEEPTILQQVRQIRMPAPEMKINRLGFDGRILRAARQAGSANDDGSNDRYVRKADRAAPRTTQINLTTKEVIAEVRLPYEILEDNLEGQSLQTHIIRQIAARCALDLEEKGLWGDTALAATDAYLGQQDGWMKLANQHILDWDGAGINASLFTSALLTLPQKYLRLLDQMKAFVSPADIIRYTSWLQARGTVMGDQAIMGNAPLTISGLKVEGAASMSLGPNNTLGHGLITPPKNLIWGITRDITIETDKDIRSREHIIVVTARVGMQIDDREAIIRVDDIGQFADTALPVRVTNTAAQPVLMKTVA
jgi:hypothetical protein